jgi:hypothetical protein
MSHLSNEPSTKDKLATIVQGFDDFDSEMKRGTRVSRLVFFCCQGNLLVIASTRERRVSNHRIETRNDSIGWRTYC